MARDHARIQLAILNDDDFRACSPGAQHLYYTLLLSEDLSYCGVADWRPTRILPLSEGWTMEQLQDAAAELATKLYIVVDEDTEEVLVRSFVRHDGLMKQPKMATAMARAYAKAASKAIRGVIIWELQRLQADEPDFKGWGSEEASKMLERTGIDPSVYPSGYPSANPSVSPSVKGKQDPSSKGPPTPYSLLPTPNSITPSLPGALEDQPPLGEQPGKKIPADGWKIVRANTDDRLGYAVHSSLALQASTMLHGGTSEEDVAACLRIWDAKPEAGPGLLPHFLAQAIKERITPAAAAAGPATAKATGWIEAGRQATTHLDQKAIAP